MVEHNDCTGRPSSVLAIVVPDHPRSGHVVLLGPMGAGKTTVGRTLSEVLGMGFADSDDAIEAETGGSGADYAAAHGVPALHVLERDVFLASLQEKDPSVISAAASVIDDAEVRRELDSHVCIWLDADPEVRTARRVESGHRRPMAEDSSTSLDERRRPHFEGHGIVRVDTTKASVDDCVTTIVAALG